MAKKKLSRQNSINSDKKICIMWRNVSTWQILLHISPQDMIFIFIYYVKTFSNWQFVMRWTFSTWQSVIWKNFSTWQIFSPQAPLVVLVTNMRYVIDSPLIAYLVLGISTHVHCAKFYPTMCIKSKLLKHWKVMFKFNFCKRHKS